MMWDGRLAGSANTLGNASAYNVCSLSLSLALGHHSRDVDLSDNFMYLHCRPMNLSLIGRRAQKGGETDLWEGPRVFSDGC